MPDFGFCNSAYEAASLTQDDQWLINWYLEIDPMKQPGERGHMALYPCPGITTKFTLPTVGAVRALHPLPSGQTLLAVAGGALYSVNTSFIATFVGNLLTSTGPVSISDNGVSAYIGDGQNRYYYTWGTGTFASIADGGFTGANTIDIIDNFLVYNNPNSNQWGATDAGSVVSQALSFASVLSAPGNLIGLIVVSRQVFLLAENTGEVWVDAGLFPFPFQIVPGTTIQHGCVAAGSIARLGESFAWLAKDTRGMGIVAMMNGYTPTRISTHAIETAIASYSVISDAVAYTYQQAGHEFYMLTFPTADVTWCYDLATGKWHRRAWRDSYNVLHRHRSNCAAVFAGQVLVGDWENGNVYAMSQSNYTDAGATLPCIRRCPHLTNDLKQTYYSDLQLQFQPGVGLQTGQGDDPQAMLTWSDDGGSTWSNQHWATIGRVGKYKNRAMWRRLGQARDRIFQVEVTDPVYRVIVSANLNATAGAN